MYDVFKRRNYYYQTHYYLLRTHKSNTVIESQKSKYTCLISKRSFSRICIIIL